MDEAKSLVHMSVSAIFAAMLIAAAISLIGIGYTIWAYFSRQDSANSRMSEYSNYTAFDNTTVRGQEVMQLISSDLDVFVVILEDTTSSEHSIDNITSVSSTPIAISTSDSYEDFVPSSIDMSTDNAIVTCSTALSRFQSIGDKLGTLADSRNLKDASHDELVQEFTSGKLAQQAVNSSGSLIETNSYAAFKSVLVYDSDNTADVVGIILVRANEDVVQ